MFPEKIVIDTSIFINPDSFNLFGNSPREALDNILNKIYRKNIKVYIPPLVLEEIIKCLNKEDLSLKNLSLIQKKPARKYEILVPSLFLYELVEEIRQRINKGLRVAEKYTRKALTQSNEQELIKSLREEYRIALREGIIDSSQDVELLILAKDIEAPLASSDKGLIKWAHKLGIETITPQELKNLLQDKNPD